MNYYFEKIKFCPVCGNKYSAEDFYQEEFLFKCKSCSYNFYQEPLPATALIIPTSPDYSEILLTIRNIDPHKGKLDLTGGFMKLDETPYEGAIREAKEEVGIDVEIDKIIDAGQTIYRYQNLNYSNVVFYFVTKPIAKNQIEFDKNELGEVKFVDQEFINQNRDNFAFKPDLGALDKYFSLYK